MEDESDRKLGAGRNGRAGGVGMCGREGEGAAGGVERCRLGGKWHSHSWIRVSEWRVGWKGHPRVLRMA